MSPDRVQRTVFLSSSSYRTRDELYKLFNTYGEIRGVYPISPSHEPPQSQYFIEFYDSAVVQSAVTLPRSCRARSASQTAKRGPPRCAIFTLQEQQDESIESVKDRRSTDDGRTNAESLLTGQPPYVVSERASVTVAASNVQGRSHAGGDENKENAASLQMHRQTDALPLTVDRSESLLVKPGLLAGGKAPTTSIMPTPTTSHPSTRDGNVHLSFHGETVPVALDNLDDSPEDIITVLRATANQPHERGKWMLVGAHYRTQGNIVAALAVMDAMIEVMLSVGMDDSDLKPARLLLSSCHLDIAKRLRKEAGMETAESKRHFSKACDGLRTVYGAFVPPTCALGEHNKQPHLSTTSRDEPTSLVEGSQNEEGSPATPKANPVREQSPDSAQLYSQLKIFEREVQCLRDRQANQTERLSRARSAKHKLEDELEAERRVRRRLEARLEKVEDYVSGVQQGERLALEQCSVEAATRRRAEEDVEKMRQEVVDVRATLEPKVAEYGEWERKLKDFFGKMGIAFVKAARGDFGEAMLNRS
ncbi:hypothetical protein FKP32DRAFT_1672547 [Trametes sanguinea]|nr:hypothetical protein FKP32DRAFT_1672547 [Trametes sanguinea]